MGGLSMNKKKKAASSTANLPNDYDKSSNSSRVIQQVRSIFLSGRKVTAKEINSETNSMMPVGLFPLCAMLKAGI